MATHVQANIYVAVTAQYYLPTYLIYIENNFRIDYEFEYHMILFELYCDLVSHGCI